MTLGCYQTQQQHIYSSPRICCDINNRNDGYSDYNADTRRLGDKVRDSKPSFKNRSANSANTALHELQQHRLLLRHPNVRRRPSCSRLHHLCLPSHPFPRPFSRRAPSWNPPHSTRTSHQASATTMYQPTSPRASGLSSTMRHIRHIIHKPTP